MIIQGIFSGLFLGVVPMYLSEIAPVNLRGLAGTLNQLFLVIGNLFANVSGLPQLFGTTNLWPVLGGFCLVPIIAHLLLSIAPETPKFLFMNLGDREGSKRGFDLMFICIITFIKKWTKLKKKR